MTSRTGATRLCGAVAAAVVAVSTLTAPTATGATGSGATDTGAAVHRGPVLSSAPAGCGHPDGKDRYGDFRTGHLNILRTLSGSKFRADFRRITERSDLVSLNEVAGRTAYLKKWAARNGWWFYAGKPAAGSRDNAILARRCLFSLKAKHSELVPGRKLPNRPLRYLNWVRFEHRATGMDVALFSTHVYAHIESGGSPRNTATAREATAHLRLLKKRATQVSRTAQVIVGADMNVDYSADKRVANKKFPYVVLENRQSRKTPGLRSQYSLRGVKKLATHGNRRIDYLYLWERVPANQQLFMTNYYTLGNTRSDHNGVVAKFWINRLPTGRAMHAGPADRKERDHGAPQ